MKFEIKIVKLLLKDYACGGSLISDQWILSVSLKHFKSNFIFGSFSALLSLNNWFKISQFNGII